jgi:hypothetical protein
VFTLRSFEDVGFTYTFRAFEGLKLRSKDKAVLRKIGSLGGARVKDYAQF